MDTRSALVATQIAGVPPVAAGRVIVAGHSLGAKGAFMAAVAEPAFAGVIALDPVDGAAGNPLASDALAQPTLVPDAVATLSKPALVVGAEYSKCAIPIPLVGRACAPAGQDGRAFASALPPGCRWPFRR
jgi:pimeloyl-ACP methyl ester carboxylesterase